LISDQVAQKIIERLGGKGSGNIGHSGRQGKRGGSAPKGSSSPLPEKFEPAKTIKEASQFLIDNFTNKLVPPHGGKFGSQDLGMLNSIGQTCLDVFQETGMSKLDLIEIRPDWDNAAMSTDGTTLLVGDEVGTVSPLQVLVNEKINIGKVPNDTLFTNGPRTETAGEIKARLSKEISSIKSGHYDCADEHSMYAFKDQVEATVRHELGHKFLTDNQDKVGNFFTPLVNKKIMAEEKKRGKSLSTDEQGQIVDKYFDSIAPSERAKDSPQELGAETFCLYSAGKIKLLNPVWTKLYDSLTEWKWGEKKNVGTAS